MTIRYDPHIPPNAADLIAALNIVGHALAVIKPADEASISISFIGDPRQPETNSWAVIAGNPLLTADPLEGYGATLADAMAAFAAAARARRQ